MSARISGVKNGESKANVLVRALPFSQVQSQSENGATLPPGGGGAVVGSCTTATVVLLFVFCTAFCRFPAALVSAPVGACAARNVCTSFRSSSICCCNCSTVG